jgi:hypothetical protein
MQRLYKSLHLNNINYRELINTNILSIIILGKKIDFITVQPFQGCKNNIYDYYQC